MGTSLSVSNNMQRHSLVLVNRAARGWQTQPCRGIVSPTTQPSTGDGLEWRNARPFSEVPGPKPLPLIGNAWRFMPIIGTLQINDFMKFMQLMYKTYGPIVKISNIGKQDMMLLFDPRDFEAVYRSEGAWPERPGLDSFSYYRNVTRRDIFKDYSGLVASNGEAWQKIRSFVNPVLMQPKNMKMYAARVDLITNDFIKTFPSMLDEKQELPEDFINEMQKWTLESTAMIAMDTRLGCLTSNFSSDSVTYKIIHAIDEIFQLLNTLDLGFPFWKFVSTPTWQRYVRALDLFTEICMEEVTKAKERLREGGGPRDHAELSVLEQLLRKEPDGKMAVVMAMDMILAGVDTTAYSTAGVLYHLARHPERQERLFQEVLRALPEPDSPITVELLEDLKFLKACVRENNRLNTTTFGTGRRNSVDIVVSNYRIPKGTDIVMCHSVASKTEVNFPEADRFVPERWIKAEGECPFPGHKPHPFAMMPFGFGKRNCVGMRFAVLQLETLVARLVRNYRLEWHHGDMRFKSTSLYGPADPLRFRLFRR